MDVAAWIQAATSIAIAYFAFRSALAARVATAVAAQAQSDQRQGAKVARRELYYRALIGEPALAAVGPFVKDTLLAVERALDASREHRTQLVLGQSLLGVTAADPFKEFETRYYDLRDTLITRVQLWGVDSFTQAVAGVLDDLGDEATISLEHAVSDGARSTLNPILQRHTARLVHLIWLHDPGAQGTELQVPAPAPRRLLDRFQG